MPNFNIVRFVVCACLLGVAGRAQAQKQVQGFAVERMYLAPPGGAWIVMDRLDLDGGLGGAIGLTLGYAHRPLTVTDGLKRLAVVSDQAFADIGAAITYRRWRFYLNIESPLVIRGGSGVVGDYSFSGPSVDLASNPDLLSDARVGTDVRIVGKPGSRFRFGASAQLFIPFGDRSEYDTDGTFRGAVRALFAGDVRYFTYAAQLGVHIRPLDDSPAPGSPKGSELLFGMALGAKLPLRRDGAWIAVLGPELYGATAYRAFFTANGTAFEGMVSGHLESTRNRANIRIKVGVGGGLNRHFGAPEARVVVGVELFGRHGS